WPTPPTTRPTTASWRTTTPAGAAGHLRRVGIGPVHRRAHQPRRRRSPGLLLQLAGPVPGLRRAHHGVRAHGPAAAGAGPRRPGPAGPGSDGRGGGGGGDAADLQRVVPAPHVG